MNRILQSIPDDWLGCLLPLQGNYPPGIEFRPGPHHTLLLGEDNGDRSTVLVFSQDAPDPCLAVKIARGRPAMDGLQNESEVLNRLGAGAGRNPALRIGPRFLAFRDFGSFAALVQEFLDGETLFRRLRTPPGIALSPLTSLIEVLMDATASVGREVADAKELLDSARMASGDQWKSCVDELAARLGVPATQRDDSRGVIGKLKQKIDRCHARFLQHGDLFPKNILVPHGSGWDGVRVIDWADAGFHLPPLFDVVLFFATLWHSHTGPLMERERLDHFQTVFWRSTPISPLLDKAIRKGRELWRLDDDWTREDLVFLTLAVYARRIAARYGTGHGEFEILMKNARHALDQLCGVH